MTLSPEYPGSTRWIAGSGAPFLSALFIFFFSILLSLWQTNDEVWIGAKYYATVVLSVCFTGLMIVFISITIQELGESASKDESVSLGFANVSFNRYVKETNPEWLLSLTTPSGNLREIRTAATDGSQPSKGTTPRAESTNPQDTPRSGASDSKQASPPVNSGTSGGVSDAETPQAGSPLVESAASDKIIPAEGQAATTQDKAVGSFSDAPLASGFGAPLWVLLLSVVGSSVFTIKMVVDNLKEPLDFDNAQMVRGRVSEVLTHQFYILFAPLGGIFIYQLLVAAGSASEPITVGLAALASGIALNAVLERAWVGVQAVVKSK